MRRFLRNPYYAFVEMFQHARLKQAVIFLLCLFCIDVHEPRVGSMSGTQHKDRHLQSGNHDHTHAQWQSSMGSEISQNGLSVVSLHSECAFYFLLWCIRLLSSSISYVHLCNCNSMGGESSWYWLYTPTTKMPYSLMSPLHILQISLKPYSLKKIT